jgi:hypothetical protein
MMTLAVTLNVLHGLILVSIPSAVVRVVLHCGELGCDVGLLTLQQSVHQVANLQIAWAKPTGIATATLRFGLKPEQVAIRRGRKLEDEDPAVYLGGGRVVLLLIVGNKLAILGDHYQVELRLAQRGVAWSPAEVDEL